MAGRQKFKFNKKEKAKLEAQINQLMEDQRRRFEEPPEQPDWFRALLELHARDFRSDEPDTQDIGSFNAGNMVFGSVDEVNGPGSVQVPDFNVSKFELGLLARHWAEVYLDHDLFWVVHRSTGSSNWRTLEYAVRRLTRIAELAGEELVRTEANAAATAINKQCGDDEWFEYLRGKLNYGECNLPLIDFLAGPWLKQFLGIGPQPKAA
jgi:hypothetical protein